MHIPFILAELERIGADETARVRTRQRAQVLREICLMPQPTRRTLIKRLGLRSSTVSATLDSLMRDGLVVEAGRQVATDRGRPRQIIALEANSCVAISVYVEHLTLCGGVVNLAEEVLTEEAVSIPKSADTAEFLTAFEALVRSLVRAVPRGSRVLGVAFSPIGAVDRRNKFWVSCNRWPSIANIDFNHLEESIGLPLIVRRNLETILDYEIQTAVEYQDKRVSLFSWGYGIGSAYSHLGTVLETERGNFSGVGHMVINPLSAKRCQCGALGCLEAEAAVWALLSRFNEIEPGAREEDDGYYEIVSRALLRDVPFLQEAVAAVRTGLHNLCKLYSPDYVLFLSPFASNRRLTEMLRECVERSFPDEVHYEPEFRVIGASFRGCLFANVYPLFRAELQRVTAEDAANDS